MSLIDGAYIAFTRLVSNDIELMSSKVILWSISDINLAVQKRCREGIRQHCVLYTNWLILEFLGNVQRLNTFDSA
jgi:hypothetical protein